MTGQAGAHTNRPELVAAHGYDTKYAMHALRLGLQGIELLTTGSHHAARPEPHRSIPALDPPWRAAPSRSPGRRLRTPRPGWPSYGTTPPFADQPDRAWVDDWLHRSYLNSGPRDH